MDNFNQINTVKLREEQVLQIAIDAEKTRNFMTTIDSVTVGLSSGTSGHRGIFVATEREQAMWSGTVLARFLPRAFWRKQRIAFFLRANSNLYESVRSRTISFKYFDIYKDMHSHIAHLNSYRPTILVAPPSILMVLANAKLEGKLQCNFQKIISVAEVLELSDNRLFCDVFEKPFIYQAYQCTEGFLAATCEMGKMHLNEEFVIVEREYIDNTKRFIPIITDVYRRSEPIVRYRLNDILIESSEPCDCGRVTTVIERIEGREDDTFLCRNRQGEMIPVYADMIGRCMLYASGFKEYRVVQTSDKTVTIYIDVISRVTKQSIIAEFQRLFDGLSCDMPTLRFRKYIYNPAKKLKRIEREM